MELERASRDALGEIFRQASFTAVLSGHIHSPSITNFENIKEFENHPGIEFRCGTTLQGRRYPGFKEELTKTTNEMMANFSSGLKKLGLKKLFSPLLKNKIDQLDALDRLYGRCCFYLHRLLQSEGQLIWVVDLFVYDEDGYHRYPRSWEPDEELPYQEALIEFPRVYLLNSS